MAENSSRPDDLLAACYDAIRSFTNDPERYAKFLRMQGRVFKHNVGTALAFFLRDPDTSFIASAKQWQRYGYTVQQGADAIRFTDKDGVSHDLYTFSQIEEKDPPHVWMLRKDDAAHVAEVLHGRPNEPLIVTAMNSVDIRDRIPERMQTLGIAPQKYQAFYLSYIRTVATVMAGRLEMGGNALQTNADTTILSELPTDELRMRFLAFAARDARDALNKIEEIVLQTQAEKAERKEQDEQDELRSMGGTVAQRAGGDPGRAAAGDPAGDADQQADEVRLQEDGGGDRMGDDPDHAERQQHEMVPSVSAEAARRADAVVSARPDQRPVQHDDREGADAGGGADRGVRDALDGVHGGAAPGSGRADADETAVSDGGQIGGQRSGDVSGAPVSAVRADGAEAGDVRGDLDVGEAAAVLHGERSDAGEGLGADHDTVSKINDIFSDGAQAEGSAELADPSVSEIKTDAPILTMPDSGVPIDLREVKALRITNEYESIIQYDESELTTEYASFRYDPELSVIEMFESVESSASPYDETSEGYVSLEAAQDAIHRHLTGNSGAMTTIQLELADGRKTTFAAYCREQLTQETAALDLLKHDLAKMMDSGELADAAKVAAEMSVKAAHAAALRKVVGDDALPNGGNTPPLSSNGGGAAPAETDTSFASSTSGNAEDAIHRAFSDVYETYSLSGSAREYLERAEKQMQINGYAALDVKMFGLPVFVQSYGRAHRVDTDLFDGKLKEIVHSINDRLQQDRQEATYQIYQIKAGEQYHGIRYESYADNAAQSLTVSDYDLVYEGDWNELEGSTDAAKLEALFAKLSQGELPEGFTGHSLTVSDVVTVPGDTAYYVDRIGFTEMPGFFPEKVQEQDALGADLDSVHEMKIEERYHFYIIADLKTWANNEHPRSALEKFDTLDGALERFRELRSAPYNSEVALDQDGKPYARLTLGVSRVDRTGDLDILHVRAGRNDMVTDYTRSPGYSDDPLFMQAMHRIADEVGFDSVTDYERHADGRWSDAIEMSYPDWLQKKDIEASTLQGLLDEIPVISEDGAKEIMQIFEDTKQDGWETSAKSQDEIRKALTFRFGNPIVAEKGLEVVARYKYHVEIEPLGADEETERATYSTQEEAQYDQLSLFDTPEGTDEAPMQTAAPEANESPIHLGRLGNGITAYDVSRIDPETNDHPIVAHISEEGVLDIRDRKPITDGDLMRLREAAAAQRDTFRASWDSLPIEQRFAQILARADAAQMLQIGRDTLPMEEKVARYERSVVFREEPFPQITPENTAASAHDTEDMQRFAEAFGLDVQQLTALVETHPTEENVNQYGRLNALVQSVDKDRAASVVDPDGTMLPHQRNMRISNAIRSFVLHGTMPDALLDQRATYSTEMPEDMQQAIREGNEKTVAGLGLGDHVMLPEGEFVVSEMRGDVSITLQNSDPEAMQTQISYLGNWKQEMVDAAGNEPIVVIGAGLNEALEAQKEAAASPAESAEKKEEQQEAASQTTTETAKRKGRPTRSERLYQTFTEMFPQIADGSHSYERYGHHDDPSGWEPLSVEHLGGDTYSYMTSYIQNGDLMNDPMFSFRLDRENARLEILEYQQDGVPPYGTVYERVEDEGGHVDEKLRAALEENFLQVLRNAAFADRPLSVYDDRDGQRVTLTEEPETPEEALKEVQETLSAEDATPELRAVLNAFSQKHGLGMLQLTPERFEWKLNEVMKDGTEHPLGSVYPPVYGMPFTPETLEQALGTLENSVKERGMDFGTLYGREALLHTHGGMSPLPRVRDDLPEIVYADSPSDRISGNLNAIRELLRLERADQRGTDPYPNRHDSKEASEARLRQYCGWGGLPQVFDERYKTHEYIRDRLKGLLTPEEYAAARASTLNSHYTSQTIIDAMYRAVKSMGLSRDSRILEPSCGTGNFIARMPHSIGQGGVVGVEIDSITARIAGQLARNDPKVEIIESGFEQTQLENDSFDLAIGNIPFGNYTLNDPDYTKDWLIHDAFFRKALDKVAPGGVVAFVTSTGTLDKVDPKVREYLAELADLIGAIRLPNTAFASAGTKVSSDIIFLQKRAEPLRAYEAKPSWCYVTPNEDGLRINSYFVENPQMILGRMEKTSHFDMLTCMPIEGADLKKQLADAVGRLNARIKVQKRENAVKERRGQIAPWGKHFTFQIKDDKVYYRSAHEMQEIRCTDMQKAQYKALCGLRDLTRELLDKQKTTVSDEALAPLREKLGKLYDAYHAAFGDLNTKQVRKLFGTDADVPILFALETKDAASGRYQKSDIFFRRTVNPTVEITAVQTADEALQVSLDKRGMPDVAYMATLLNKSPEDVCSELLEKGQIFIDPEKELPDRPYSGIVERAEYLSGNVRRKLAMAENAAQQRPELARNVEALRSVIPEDIRAEEISVRMGCAWIDEEDYTAFLAHLSGRSPNDPRCKVSYSPVTGEFNILNAGSQKELVQNEMSTYGTPDLNLYELAQKILNQRRIVVHREVPHPQDASKLVTRTDAKATKVALDKATLIKAEFVKWIFADDARRAKYERRYNDIFNSLVGRTYDGSGLTFSGMASDFTLRPHQKDCVARAIYGGNTLAAHVVGAGKSAVMFTTVMKKKELGLISKACVVVPKPLTEQVAAEWRRLYPDAKLLTVTNDDLSTEAKRDLFTARVATGAYDAVIMSQEQFEKIPMSKEYRASFIQRQIDKMSDMLRERKDELGGKCDHSVKQMERYKKQLEGKLNKLLDPKSAAKAKDGLLEFEQLGFDYLVVDEAHAYKNGFVTTKMTNVAGVTTRPSGRAEDMQMKTDWFNETMGQGHLLLCTGTPNASPYQH